MAIMMPVRMVARKTKAVVGQKWRPMGRPIASVRTNWTTTPTYGELHRGWSLASGEGSSPILDMAYQVRVVASVPAFPLANVEFKMAKNATTQPTPHTSRPNWIHGLPPPSEPKLTYLVGPKNTSPA